MPGGFADSPLRLNRGLANLSRWSDKEINDRAQELADLALQIWTEPQIPEDVLRRYRQATEEEASAYTIDQFEYLQGEIRQLFEGLRTRIRNLDSSVREEVKKNYIAYKTTTNFVDIVPQKNRLRLTLNMEFDEINDPQQICKDVTGLGQWGNGDIQVGIASLGEIDYIMFLVQQSFEKQTEEVAI